MAVANSTMTPLPVRWRFPQEAEEEDESLEQDSLGNGEFDSLQHPGGSPAPAPPPPPADDPTDAWAPQSILDAAPRDGHSFEMQQFAYATRDSRFDILKQAGHAFQQHLRGRADDRRYGGGGNNNNNNSYVHPAIFDQDKWEKHKQLIREYFESQQQLEETAQLTAEWNDIHNPPDWEPYRRPVLHAQGSAAQGPADGAQLPQGGTWPEALPPIREQPGEVADGDDEEEEEEDDDDEDEEEEDEDDEEEEPDGRRLSPAGEARDARPGSRDSSASPASNRGGRPTLQLVGVTLDSSSSDDASVDSGHGASASGGSAGAGAGAAGAQGPKGSPASSSSSSPPPPSSCAASVASVASQGAPAPAALCSHRKELSMDSGIQGSSCDLASGDAGASSPAGSDDGADAAADLAAAAAAAALAASRRSPPCSRFTPTLDPDALLHGETFNLVEEVYVVGNPLAGRDSLKAVPLASAPAGGRASPPVAPGPAPAAASSVPAPAPPADACPDRSRHVVVVAIDFGTTYSGYAFCFTRDPELNIHMMRKWEGGDPGLNNQKTPTTLLLTPDEKFHSFGFAARDFFHDLEIQEAKRWLFFDKFKMALHHDQDMNRDTRVQAANGRSLPALAVFAHALRHLKEQALRELSDQAGADLRPDHIRWVVTVPAIWRQPAKQFIREAAYQAGICDPARPEGLLIALEPEAASICCRKLRLNQLVPEPRPALPPPPPLRLSGLGGLCGDASREAAGLVLHGSPSGMRYMVVDCGGGTVDITVHELSERSGTLRELHKATGGPWGSMGVDAEFERLLGDVFGEELVAQFKAKRPASYTELMVSWEARKRSASPHRDSPLSVFPPFSFIDFFRKTKGKEIEQAVRKYGRKEVTWSSQGALRLQPSVMRELFQPTIHKILRYIQDVLDSPRVHGIQYLFLVGGFAESQLLQHEVRTAFSTRVRVVIPQPLHMVARLELVLQRNIDADSVKGVALTTLRGAVLFGLEPGVVTVRRSKHTYGVGVLKRFQPGVHPEEKLVERDGVQWCADVLDKFVSAEQSVALGEAVVRRYTPALPAQSSILINIYCADSDEAQFTTDPGVRRCGALRLDLSSSSSSGGGYASASASGASGDSSDDPEAPPTRPREIHTRMVFGGTEITASALDLASGSCVHVDVDFLTM